MTTKTKRTTNRDAWCTPREIAELIGPVDLDPCSNERSHIQAANTLCGRSADDCGLSIAPVMPSWIRAFINPPYSRGQVIRWVDAYLHVDFMFLLRWDPSTTWFKRLMSAKPYIWFFQNRIEFEPPPGVQSSSNPFPHALYTRSVPNGNLLAHGVLLRHA